MGTPIFEKTDLFKKRYRRSLLRKLPLARQTALVARIDDGAGYMEVARELTQEGIPTSAQMLSDFCQWFALREKLWGDADFALELADVCKARGWIKSARDERAAAQLFFNRTVLADKDPKAWSIVERVNIAKDKVALEKAKVDLEKRKYRDKREGKKNKQPGATPISDEEKEAALRQIYGMSS